ncbi:hypothetical protein [Janthinobacterium sp. SUN033]|uniref:hypothetical protein n=1 Tax=Janthinobacterium sp. SUN033 TaxID=3002439 RepID=UPI0025B1F5FE|nr:hypothetical protein [Janthinobacterium sp. SUN033]MDN2675648.1 hypothetical protein [Janthinobacterium sp. SUN033]
MTIATDMLAKYLAAEAAILEGKEVKLGDRTLRMEDLGSVIIGRKEWQQAANHEIAAAGRTPSIGGLGFALARFGDQ